MIFLLETNVGRQSITISAKQEPFEEMRRLLGDLPRAVWAEQFLCDREARHWFDIHALQQRDLHIGVMKDASGDLHTVWNGIPIEISDDLLGEAA